MTQAQHYKPADVRRLLLHTYVTTEHRDEVCRLAAGRFRV